MIPKLLLLGSFLALLVTGNVNGQWDAESIPTKSNLNSMDLFNENSGWIVGDNGTMLYKYMESWMSYPKVTDEDLYSVCLISNTDGWVVGSNGTILRYNGMNWVTYPSPTKQKLLSVSFRDPEHGIASGVRGTVLEYEKGTWRQVETSIRGNIYAVADRKDVTMAAGGLECLSVPVMTFDRTSEKKLISTFEPGFVEIKSIMIPDKKKIWAVGSYGSIFHFDGTTWQRTDLGDKIPTLNSVFFSDDTHGMAVGYSGIILTYSPDGWTINTSPVNVRLNDAVISGNMYYAIGNNGTLISMRQYPVTVKPDKPSDKKAVVETYPNPSKGNVNVIIPDNLNMRSGVITITNLYGQVVYMENLYSMTGGQNYQINTSGLSDGLYLVNIVSADISSSGKFIVR